MDLTAPIVYIITDNFHRTLQIGLSESLSELEKLCYQKNKTVLDYTKLVYFEVHANLIDAAERKAQLSGWRKEKTTELISNANYIWRDLITDLLY